MDLSIARAPTPAMVYAGAPLQIAAVATNDNVCSFTSDSQYETLQNSSCSWIAPTFLIHSFLINQTWKNKLDLIHWQMIVVVELVTLVQAKPTVD